MREAGRFYPASFQELSVLFSVVRRTQDANGARAVILPHAGYLFSLECALAAIAGVGGGFLRIVLLAPSHVIGFAGCALGDYAAWETPFGEVAVDKEEQQRLASLPGFFTADETQAREHALEVEMPILKHFFPDTPVLPITVGQLDGPSLQAAIQGLTPLFEERTLFCISSDFTHYGRRFGYAPLGSDAHAAIRQLDDEAIRLLEQRDRAGFEAFLARTDATICGREVIRMFLELSRGTALQVRCLSRTDSCEIAGNFDGVGYASFLFEQEKKGR